VDGAHTRISSAIARNLSPSQVLELLKLINDTVGDDVQLLALRTVVEGIKAREVITFVSDYLKTMFRDRFIKKMRRKDVSEDLFTVYFLTIELSDEIAFALFDKKIIKKAPKRSENISPLFPVILLVRG
jgi:hypothetical protein